MLLAGLMLPGVAPWQCFSAGSHESRADRTAVFDLDGKHILQEPEHLGIVNGKLTTGIEYRDVAGLAGLWAPPYVSSNFMLDGRVDGEKVATANWTWRPFQVERHGNKGPIQVSSTTTLIHGERAVIVSFQFKNSSRAAVPLEFFALGWLDKVQEWGFARPTSGTETSVRVEGQRLKLKQGDAMVLVAMNSPAWKWEASGNVGRASFLLPARQSHSVDIVVAIGPAVEAEASLDRLLANPAATIVATEQAYSARVRELFQKLPVFESDNDQLVQWYHRSLVHLLMNRWDVPEFALQPYYSTGSVKGGCVANYLWNFGETWEIFPLYDASAARSHIQQFLKCDLLKHFLFNPITGAADGPWYMVNQEKIIGLTYYYVLLTGDTAFLAEKVEGQSIRDHMVTQAMFVDDVSKPMALIDYGPSNSHLELRRGYAYHHVMPDLNARRYANYLRAATLCELAGRPAPFLRERAALLRPLIKQKLWDTQARWFRCDNGKGQSELRYTVQMFKPLGGGVLDRECVDGLLSHLNEREFLSAYGLHSLSKTDPAYDQLDIDNGGGGICTSFPAQIIEKLYQEGRPEMAANILGRLLWWGEAMPYWGDSIAANCKDYRRDTPLQCTFDGAAAAQSIIFGVFGVSVRPEGDLVIKPNPVLFAKRMALKGLKLRGQTLEVRVDAEHFEVRSSTRSIRARSNQAVIVAIKDGALRIENPDTNRNEK